MSQPDSKEKPPEQQNSNGNFESSTSSELASDLFSEVLFTGKEIEGLFEKKRREEMQANGGKMFSRKRGGTNGLKNPLSILKERLEIYNKKRDPEFHLFMDEEEDLSYSGPVTFTYSNGYQTLSEKLKITNSNTAKDIIPQLLRTFLPQYDMNEINSNTSYIIFSQGGSERELEATEKPLEIALDYSTKGLSSPSFSLKTSLSLLLSSSTPQKRAEGKLSTLSLQAASSLSSIGHTSSDSESPKVGSPHILFEDHDSLYSFSSTSSIPMFAHHHPISNSGNRSPHSLTKSQTKIGKSRSHTKQSQKSQFEKLSEPPQTSSSPVPQQLTLTPELNRKAGGKSKSKVGSFMKSLRSKKKMRPPSIYPEDGLHGLPDPRKSALVSPKLAEKRFSMPTVFHIYYSKAKNMQLYKSVLVSENSTARDVIKQALERYGMNFMSLKMFDLYEVIGRWEEVCNDVEPALERSVLMPDSSRPIQKITSAFEEFIECYTRKLDHNEKPYDVQFFHEPQTGYTRRFELRSALDDDDAVSEGTLKSHDQFVPTTPVFGSTSHCLPGRRSRSKSQDTFEFLTETEDEPLSQSSSCKGNNTIDAGLNHSLVDCSSPDSIDVLTPLQSSLAGCSLYPSITSGIFLLNLHLLSTKHEFIVYNLLSDQFILRNKSATTDFPHSRSTLESQAEACIDAHESKPGSILCTIRKSKSKGFVIQPGSCFLSINGKEINVESELSHGDLIKIDCTHLFMFQNHVQFSEGQYDPTWPYQWKPRGLTETLEKRKSTTPVKSISAVTINTKTDELQKPLTTQAQVVYVPQRDDICSLPTLQEVESTERSDNMDDYRSRSQSETRVYLKKKSKNLKSPSKAAKHTKALSSGQITRNTNKHGMYPIDRKLVFSYNMSEEETLLELIIDDLDPPQVVFALAPAYVLSMCMEYSLRCSGPSSASRLACKAVEKIQKRVEKITDQIMSWQPTTKPNYYPSIDEIHISLCSMLFWLANTLEFYNFLLTQDSLDLSIMTQAEDGENTEDNSMTILENIMQHLFQQAFYPISKILYVVLPRMLEESDVDRSSSVHYVVDFLKRILELMFELHIHTEMIAQFFANIFFFLNGAMFNALIDQGPTLDLFQYSTGKKLRMKLDILENWAGREGFKDGPLQFFAVFSSAVDLISTPPDELLTLSWSVLREEFPALLPSQLHYILAHYLLPESIEEPPVQWTPVLEDGATDLSKNSLHESFESHPQFEIPIGGYLLDLDSQSCDYHMLHEFVDALKKDLRKKQKSVNIVGIKKKQSSTPSVPTMVYSTNTYPPSPVGKRIKKPLLDIHEIVTPDLAITSYEKSAQEKAVTTTSAATTVKSEQLPHLRDRVKSIVEPHFTAPEKLMILYEKQVEAGQTINEEADEEDCSAKDVRTLSLQRGNRGFGFNTESRKDPLTGDKKLYISSLIPDGGIEDIIDICAGDQILAVDELQMSCEEAQQYIKDAEEEIMITVCSSNSNKSNSQ